MVKKGDSNTSCGSTIEKGKAVNDAARLSREKCREEGAPFSVPPARAPEVAPEGPSRGLQLDIEAEKR